MTTLQARKILGIDAKNMSDADIDELLSNFYSLGEIILDIIQKNGSNKQVKVIDTFSGKGQNNGN